MIKILIVDDDVEVIRSLGNTFTTLLKGYLVLTATTANQGLNFIKQEKPDLIIMDVRLGPVSGMDLLEDYPKHTQDYEPRVIVITAFENEKARRKAEELKVDAFLLKPFEKGRLLGAVFDSIEKYLEAQRRTVHFARQAFSQKEDKSDSLDKKIDKKLGGETPS